MATRGLNTEATRVKQLILGTQKYYPNASVTLQVGGTAYTVSALTQLMQSFVNARDAVEAAKAAAKATVQTEQSQSPSQSAVIRAFETVVRGTFGTKARRLGGFRARAPQGARSDHGRAEGSRGRKARRHSKGAGHGG